MTTELVFKGENSQVLTSSYKKLHDNESKLDVAERNGFINKIYDIISNLIREGKAA